MALGKNRYRVLIVGAGEKVYELFRELLPPEGYEPPLRAASAGEARRMLQDTQVDLVILNAPLRDEFGTQLALKLAEEDLGVLLLVPAECYDEVCYKVEDEGVLTLGKPASRGGILSALGLLRAMRGKLLKFEKKNQTLQEKMQDIRRVNRAKWLLIEHLHLTEQEAHYHIEKKAMDLRQSRREVAEDIIRYYEQ